MDAKNTNFDSNPFSLLRFSNKYYLGSNHILDVALDVVGSWHPASLEVVGLLGMGKTSLLRFISSSDTLKKYSHHFDEPYKSDPYRLLPVLIEFQYWNYEIDPLQYIFDCLQLSLKERVEMKGSLEIENHSHIEEIKAITKQQSTETTIDIASQIINLLHILDSKQFRLVFLIDGFDEVLKQLRDKDRYIFDKEIVSRLRAWRSDSSFVICSETKLADVDGFVSSNLFGLFDPVYITGLKDDECIRLLSLTKDPDQLTTHFPVKDIDFLTSQVGNHPYLLVLGGKLLWDIRDQYKILEKLEKPLDDIQKNILIEQIYTKAEYRFKIYWDKLSWEEQLLLGRIAERESSPNLTKNSMSLHKLLSTGLVLLDSKGGPVLFSALFQRFVKTQSKSVNISINLPAKNEQKLFLLLQRNCDRVCTFDEIAEEVWGIRSELTTNSYPRKQVQVLVARLNKRLKNQKSEFIIRGVWNQGYKLEKIELETPNK
jgi:hypothetical protein